MRETPPRDDRPSRFDGPVFRTAQERDRDVDALPLSPRQRRRTWWQVAVAALVADVATASLVVAGLSGGATPLLGLAVMAAVVGVPLTWVTWTLRRQRRAGRDGGR